MSKGKQLGEQIVIAVKGYVARSVAGIIARLDAIEQRLKEVPQKGEKGEDGKSVTLDDVLPLIEDAVKELPVPQDGKDGRNAFEVAVSLGYVGTVHEWMASLQGRNGNDGKSVTVDDVRPLVEAAVKAIPIPKDGKDGENGTSVTLDDVRPLIEQAIKAIPVPRDGKDGENGKSVTAEEVLPALTAELQKAIAALPVPKDGRDGIDGKDGKSVTVDDLRAMFEAEQAKWALEWERRAQDQIARTMDRIPAPKDGKDGADGLGFEDLEVVHDGERTFTVRFVRGEKVKEFAFKIPVLIERGVYRAGQQYERGDGVTLQGSYWIAQKDTTAKPGESTDWRMAVKKGRDGKDGERGLKGDPGQKGRDGRDFSQTAFPGVR